MPELVATAPEGITPAARKPSVSESPFRRVGSPNAAHRPVVVSRSTLRGIRRHLETDLTQELGGVLIGEVRAWKDREYVEVHASLAAATTSRGPTHFAFTPETWVALIDAVDERFPGQYMVGWYHSHPGLGVFFSGQDADVHRLVFDQPWHVALVIDPVANDLGFFGWVQSRLQRLPGFYLVGDAARGKPEPDADGSPDKPTEGDGEKPGAKRQGSPRPSVGTRYLIGALLLAVAAGAYLLTQVEQIGDELETLRSELTHSSEEREQVAPGSGKGLQLVADLVVSVDGVSIADGSRVPKGSMIQFQWTIANRSKEAVMLQATGLQILLDGVQRADMFISPDEPSGELVRLEPGGSLHAKGRLIATIPGSCRAQPAVLAAGAQSWRQLPGHDGLPAAITFQVTPREH